MSQQMVSQKARVSANKIELHRLGAWSGACLALIAFVAIATSSGSAANMAYATVALNGYNQFGTLDLTTGVFTSLNNAEPNYLTLAAVGGTLYATGEAYGSTAEGKLYTVNTANGNLTLVGAMTNVGVNGVEVFGSTTGGLFALSDTLTSNSVNPATGAGTLLGPSGAPGFANWYALSGSGSALYAGVQTNFYTVNTTTGAYTLVGSFGTPIVGYGLAQMGAMTFVNGVLYGAQEGSWIDTINTTTGVATGGPMLAGGYIYGLAPDVPTNPAPEPGSLALLGSGALAAAGILRRKLLP